MLPLEVFRLTLKEDSNLLSLHIYQRIINVLAQNSVKKYFNSNAVLVISIVRFSISISTMKQKHSIATSEEIIKFIGALMQKFL